MSLSAIILAGGQASRMGGEKPLRILRGKSLLQHAMDRVAPFADEILIASGAREMEVPPPGFGVEDPPEYTGDGPLAGILAGLQIATGDYAIILACDLPNLSPNLLATLVNALAEHDCAYCDHDGHPEPLVAAVRVGPARDAVQLSLEAEQHKVIPVWESLMPRVFYEHELEAFQPLEKTFANINTLEELDNA